jgi:hypothetical protein
MDAAMMNLSTAIDVIESCSGFTESDTPAGEAWAVVLSYLHPAPVVPVAEDVPHEEILRLAAKEIGYEFTGQWFLTGGKGLTLETNPLELLNFAHAILSQWGRHAIKPVPVADEGIDDLVAWLWSMRDLAGENNPDEQRRYELAATLLGQQAAETTHWRPASALPAPGAEVG